MQDAAPLTAVVTATRRQSPHSTRTPAHHRRRSTAPSGPPRTPLSALLIRGFRLRSPGVDPSDLWKRSMRGDSPSPRSASGPHERSRPPPQRRPSGPRRRQHRRSVPHQGLDVPHARPRGRRGVPQTVHRQTHELRGPATVHTLRTTSLLHDRGDGVDEDIRHHRLSTSSPQASGCPRADPRTRRRPGRTRCPPPDAGCHRPAPWRTSADR